MNKSVFLSQVFVLFAGFATAQMKYEPPTTQALPVTDTVQGVLLTDRYRWLEDKTDPKVIAWTRKQHDFTARYLDANQRKYSGLRASIAKLIDLDDEGPLEKEGKRVFQRIKLRGDKQSKIYTILNGKKKLVWDPVALDTAGNISTQSVSYSYDGERAAIAVQKSGAEISTIYIINTRTGKTLYPSLKNTEGFTWTKDQQHAYVTVRSQEDVDKQRPLKTYYLKLGDPMEKAAFIGTTKDAQNSYFNYDSRYSDVSFSGEGNFYSDVCFMRKTGTLDSGERIYESKKSSAYPEAIGNNLYILTNDNAPNYRFMHADKSKPHYKDWKTLIPEGETVLQNCVVTKHNIIVQDKKDILSRLTEYDTTGKKLKQIELPDLGNVDAISYDREEDSVYLTLATFTSMVKIYVASPTDFKWRLYYTRTLPVDMSNIVAEIKFYPSKDGTKIPAFVLHRKGIQLDGKNPTYLTAYGGFNSGISPHYFGRFLPLLEKGVIVVEAGIRGGDEYGEKWHEAGMLANKQNCFDDFNACAEWLIKGKYTNSSRLVAEGGSNGGLLMGAIATQRPDLYKAISCQVPLLDMIRYHKFLIARYWIPEYGSSETDSSFRWLLRYSPYQNIRVGVNIPTMLVSAGANDFRVDPMNAKKFVAALQNNPGQVSPVLLHMDFNSGHGSGKSTAQIIDERLFDFSFLLDQMNVN